VIVLSSLALAVALDAQAPAPQRALPVDAISAIVEALRTHRIVALGEAHESEQFHAFLRDLLHDRRFVDGVDDIVVEFGNAKYQDVMDRFTSDGDVPYDSLRRVWQNTTSPIHVWDVPVYEQFFRTVRVVNSTLSRARPLRVVLGDSPIDWDTVHGREDIRPFANRDRWAADIIEREVLAKKHRALLIYGGTHFVRSVRSLVGLLEAEGADRIYTIWPHVEGDLGAVQPDTRDWKAPSVATLRGTVLGTAAFGFYFRVPPDRPNPQMQDVFDGLLYLGDPKVLTTSRVTPALCSDEGYIQMRIQRTKTIGFTFPPGARYPDWESAFKAACADAMKK
jgi:hypothetical protein